MRKSVTSAACALRCALVMLHTSVAISFSTSFGGEDTAMMPPVTERGVGVDVTPLSKNLLRVPAALNLFE